MAGDRWEEGRKEKITSVVIYSSYDLCGKIKDKFIKLKKVKALFLLGLFFFLSLEAE